MPDVRLHVVSRAENVVLAREVVRGLAEAMALDREQYDDIRTAVTEACDNVVQHAYPREPGPLELDVHIRTDAVEVIVSDKGVGVASTVGGDDEGLAVGLPVMLALADQVELRRVLGGGTSVRMHFPTPGIGPLPPRRSSGSGSSEMELPDLPVTARLSFARLGLAREILPRVACALAARAHFSADRVSDVQLLTDAISASVAEHSRALRVEIAITVRRRCLDLQVGPLVRGGSAGLLSASSDGLPLIGLLVDHSASATLSGPGDSERLALQLLDAT